MMNDNHFNSEVTTPDAPKPHYIREQHNHNCQQFFGPITNCVFTMPTAKATSSPKPPRTPAVARPTASDIQAAKAADMRELMTFRTKGALDANLALLYMQMVKDGWIDSRTSTDDFLALFSGKRSECKIIWAGKYGKGTLVFLFQYLEIQGCITIDRGFTIPNILMGHFVDTKGRFLTRLDKGDAHNEKAGPEVMAYAKILKLNPADVIISSEDDSSEDDSQSNSQYGGTYDPYDHQDLHLHRR